MDHEERTGPEERRARSRERAGRRAYEVEAEQHAIAMKLPVLVGGLGLLWVLYLVLSGKSEAGLHGPLIGLVACISVLVPWRRVLRLGDRVADPRGYLATAAEFATVGGAALAVYAAIELELVLALIGVVALVAGGGIWLRWRRVAWIWYAGAATALGGFVWQMYQALSEGAATGRVVPELVELGVSLIAAAMIVGEVWAWARALPPKDGGRSDTG